MQENDISTFNGEQVKVDGELMQISNDYGVGIDTHSKFIYVSVIVKINFDLRRFDKTFETSWDELLSAGKWIRTILSTKPVPPISNEWDIVHFHYTIESTSVYHYPVMRALNGKPSVVNPLLASPSRRKTDALDAKLLAYQNMTGLWPISYVVNDDINTVRILMAQRESHKKAAAKLSNQINNYILRYGQTIGRLGSISKSKYVRGIVEDLCNSREMERIDICPDGLPDDISTIILQMFDEYDNERKKQHEFEVLALKKIKDTEWEIQDGEFIKGSELLKNLCTVPGVSEISSAIWLSNICSISRFPNAKACSAFCGLDPSLKVSAGKVTSTVKRGGNKALHAALTNSASVLIRNRNEPFGIWGYQMYQHCGKWRKACSAVARKISVGMYYVHKKNEPFTYAGYKLELTHDVINIPISELVQIAPEFGRYKKYLVDNGFASTKALVEAYDNNTLKSVKGLGRTFMGYLHTFIVNQKKYVAAYQEWKEGLKND